MSYELRVTNYERQPCRGGCEADGVVKAMFLNLCKFKNWCLNAKDRKLNRKGRKDIRQFG
ncbi:MAG: hypothetical protein RIR51_553 [Bacteroidota bacterium]|jgi:hypothetical protein